MTDQKLIALGCRNVPCDITGQLNVPGQHTNGRCRCSEQNMRQALRLLHAERDRLRAALVDAAIAGYTQGHNDTVESQYGDPEDVAKEICEGLLTEALASGGGDK